MPKTRFHKLVAIAVFAGFAIWVATGEFSSVGSATDSTTPRPDQPAVAEKAPIRIVKVVVPPRSEHARAIRIAGVTAADKRAVLATRASGVIEKLPVRQGDRVKAGDLILALEAEDKTAAVATAEALLAQRKAELEAAERLAKAGTLPKLQLDTARSNMAAAQSQLETALAELDRNQVRAPFDGIVDRISVELGSSISQGGEVATMLALDPVIARGEVSERDLGYVKVGDAADVRLVNGRTVEGQVRYISRDASDTTRTFRIEVAISNADGAIPAGMTAEIALAAEPTESVVLPRSVVTLGGKGDLGIRAVDKDDKVVFFPIDLIDDTPKGLVLGGIPADARIIVAGQEFVAEGDTVDPVEASVREIRSLAGSPTATQ